MNSGPLDWPLMIFMSLDPLLWTGKAYHNIVADFLDMLLRGYAGLQGLVRYENHSCAYSKSR